jgi:hypothetical protein
MVVLDAKRGGVAKFKETAPSSAIAVVGEMRLQIIVGESIEAIGLLVSGRCSVWAGGGHKFLYSIF